MQSISCITSFFCILAGWSKSKVFLQNILSLFSPPLSVCLCFSPSRSLSRHVKTFLSPKTFSSQFPSLPASHSGVHTLPCLCLSLLFPSLPSLSHVLFCSDPGLWCFSCTGNITLTFCLCLSRTHPDTCALTLTLPSSLPPVFGPTPLKHPSTSVSLSPPLTSLASLWSHHSPSQSLCHSSKLLSSNREKERNVFRPS